MQASNNNTITICHATRRILQIYLIWPTDNEVNPGLKYKFRVFTFFLCVLILSGLVTTHVALILEILDSKPVDPETVALLIAGYGCCYMVCTYLKNRRQIALLLRDLSNFQRFGKPPGFDKLDKRLNFYLFILNAYLCITILCYGLMRFFERENCWNALEKSDRRSLCGLIAPVWLPSKLDCPPVFYFLLIFLHVVAQLLMKLPFLFSFNALEIGQHIILRLNHLKGLITASINQKNEKLRRISFKQNILYHNEILDFAARLNDAYFSTMFGHLALTGAICACLEKQIVAGQNAVVGFLHFVGWILALFVGCIGGQLFLNANDIVPTALWFSKWYEADLETKKDIVFILRRSQNLFFLRAGSFGILSYPLFVSVLKTSYSIFCLLTS